MRLVLVAAASALLIGCSGAGGGGSSKNDLAASACENYAKNQLADKTYQLDHAVLAASLKDVGDGSNSLRSPITIEPGRSSESKQTLECDVRFVAGKEQPDVLKMQFIWQ